MCKKKENFILYFWKKILFTFIYFLFVSCIEILPALKVFFVFLPLAIGRLTITQHSDMFVNVYLYLLCIMHIAHIVILYTNNFVSLHSHPLIFKRKCDKWRERKCGWSTLSHRKGKKIFKMKIETEYKLHPIKWISTYHVAYNLYRFIWTEI